MGTLKQELAAILAEAEAGSEALNRRHNKTLACLLSAIAQIG